MRNDDLNARTNPEITGYLLIMRGKDWDLNLKDDELQEAIDRTTKWFDALMKSGKVKGGNALDRGGVVVSGRNGSTVTDGPFPESKEAIGGYLLLDVPTFDEAVQIARSSPGVSFGVSVEVRPVMNECPVFKRVRERLGLAA